MEFELTNLRRVFLDEMTRESRWAEENIQLQLTKRDLDTAVQNWTTSFLRNGLIVGSMTFSPREAVHGTCGIKVCSPNVNPDNWESGKPSMNLFMGLALPIIIFPQKDGYRIGKGSFSLQTIWVNIELTE
jgi:hypothetical protein